MRSSHDTANSVQSEALHDEMRRTMDRFSAAWRRGDIDGLMALFGDDPIYRTSSGIAFEGRISLREGLIAMCHPLPADDQPPANQAETYFFGRSCLTYWTLKLANGETQAVVDGVDVITFDGQARIILKDAYRKLL